MLLEKMAMQIKNDVTCGKLSETEGMAMLIRLNAQIMRLGEVAATVNESLQANANVASELVIN